MSTTVQLVRQWGGSATDAVLDPANSLFSTPTIEGVIGYRIESGRAVVFGDPVAAPDDQPALVTAFHRWADQQSIRVLYVTVSKPFADNVLNQFGGASIGFGDELLLNPQDDPRKKTGTHASLLRRKSRHAGREGTEVAEFSPGDEKLQSAIEQVGLSWLRARHGPQIHISHVWLFDNQEGKRWFYAKQGGRVVGVLALNRLESKNGYLLNHLMAIPDAPHGVSEFLVVSALEKLAEEGCEWVTVGVVPRAVLGEITGLGALSTSLARGAFQIGRKLFRLEGRYKFWEKFHPESQPSYLWFGGHRFRPRDILGLLRALNTF